MSINILDILNHTDNTHQIMMYLVNIQKVMSIIITSFCFALLSLEEVNTYYAYEVLK